MDLSLNQQQQLLKQGVEDFRTREATRDAILELETSELGYSPTMWRTAAEIGWLGMATPEAYGGSGASLMDMAAVFEALGGGPVPGPFFSSGVLASFVIQEAGSAEQRERYLPALARGDTIYALAVTEPEWSWGREGIRMRAVPSGGGYRLSGTKLFAYDAHAADYLIVAARTGGPPVSGAGLEGVSLLVVNTQAAGVRVRRLGGFLTAECEVEFDNVEVDADELLAGTDGDGYVALERALLKATPVLCAYQVGGAQAVFELSVDYSRERRQFGQPIGRFQHVQNHIVQLVNHLDAARWTTYEATWKLDEGKPGADVSVHLAKICAGEGFVQATNYAHEVHAGVGVMREYGLTLYTRLARSLYYALGDPKWHRRRLGELLAAMEPAS